MTVGDVMLMVTAVAVIVWVIWRWWGWGHPLRKPWRPPRLDFLYHQASRPLTLRIGSSALLVAATSNLVTYLTDMFSLFSQGFSDSNAAVLLISSSLTAVFLVVLPLRTGIAALRGSVSAAGWAILYVVAQFLVACLSLNPSQYLNVVFALVGAILLWMPGARAYGHNRPKKETPEEKESRLRSAAWFRGTSMVGDRESRTEALERLREIVPGFPRGRYEAELDDALPRIEMDKVNAMDRRATLIANARELNALNAVFTLHYFNQRFSGSTGQYGLGPIDLVEALGDLHSSAQIEEAVTRSNALIQEGLRLGNGPWDWKADLAHLRRAHPGFTDCAMGEALDWAYFMTR